jgi:predicted CoA-substrate-specific enzyme activase
MITCGMDIGSRTIKALLFDTQARKAVGHRIDDTGANPARRAKMLFQALLREHSLKTKDLKSTVSTGYGRKSFSCAQKAVTEITCHARGTVFLFPQARFVIDIGGQDCKAILMDPKGRVQDFAMNDRCAAGTGRFLEMTAEILKIPMDAMVRLAMQAKKSADINSMCAVFAESEIVGLLSKGRTREEIVRGVMESLSKRTAAMAQRVGVHGQAVFSGGVAKNEAMVRMLERDLGVRLTVPEEPRITGALGAALIAAGKKESFSL